MNTFFQARELILARSKLSGNSTSARILCATRQTFALQSLAVTFRFIDTIYSSKGLLKIRIPTGNDGFIVFNVDVVSADISKQIGLRDLKKEGLLLNYMETIF